MNKVKQPINAYESGITELTLEDIKNNLKKPIYNDYLDLDNVYDFLNRVTSSKGRCGFVTIKKPETRKRSYEPMKSEDPEFKEMRTSPRIIREKSLVSSPILISNAVSPKVPKKQSTLFFLKSPEDLKLKKKQIKPISMKISAKSPVLKLSSESLIKHKTIAKDFETTRERALSPYAISLQKSTGKLPLLQTTKKRIGVLKLDKSRKRSKGKQQL